jgi:hypothetical protein
MQVANQVYVLFVERLATAEPVQPAPARSRIQAVQQRSPDWIELPAGRVSYLGIDLDQPPCVFEEIPATHRLAGVLEPIRQDNQRFLLLVSPPGHESRVNGIPAPRAAALQIRDQIRLNEDFILHVSIYERPYVGPPQDVHMDVECPLCRIRIAAGTSGVCECPNCGAVLHCEGPEKSADERLECGRLTAECPRCGQPIKLKPGFAYVPQI